MPLSHEDDKVLAAAARLAVEGDGATIQQFLSALDVDLQAAVRNVRSERPPSADPHTLSLLEELLAASLHASIDNHGLAAAIRTAQLAVPMQHGIVEESALVWTGPQVVESALRSTHVVLCEMVDAATSQIVIATYSLRPEMMDPDLSLFGRLARAQDRGVAVSLIVHQNPANREALERHWPGGTRPRLLTWPIPEGDQMVKLHAKIAEVDDHDLMISSANLTYHGMFSNLEMGIWIRGTIAGEVRRHFDRLERAGHLVLWI